MKLSHLFPAALSGASLIQATVFPVPDTPYKVQWTSSEIIDHTRPDPWNATHPRRIMISRFRPIPNRDCLQTCRVPYMNSFMSDLEDSILEGFLGSDMGWPRGVLATLEMEVCCRVRNTLHSQRRNNKFPTVLFGTGLNTTRLLYSASAQQFASMGYEVVVMDHPYDTDAVQFPDGTIIYGNRVPRDPEAVEALAFALDVRSQDASLVLDHLGVSKKKRGARVGYVGDSFGGPAAADVMLKDVRVAAGVNMDGIMFGPAVEEGTAKPFLLFGTPGHNSSNEETWRRFWNATRENHPQTWMKELSLADSVHGLLIDFALVGDVAGLRGTGELVGNLFGSITGARTMKILREYLSDFFEFALEGKSQGLLAGPNKKYPEVTFI